MNYRNARGISGNRVDCEIDHPIHGWIPYTIDPSDTDNTVDNVALLIDIGDDFSDYVEPTSGQVSALLATDLREERDRRLREIDKVVGNHLRWDEFTITLQAAWVTYRQDLLDVPQQGGFPGSVVWPTGP